MPYKKRKTPSSRKNHIYGLLTVLGLIVIDSHLYHAIGLALKEVVSLLDSTQRIAVSDEQSSVNLSLSNQAKHLLAVAAVYAASLECEVFAVHVG